jgi:hypothetical protein
MLPRKLSDPTFENEKFLKDLEAKLTSQFETELGI